MTKLDTSQPQNSHKIRFLFFSDCQAQFRLSHVILRTNNICLFNPSKPKSHGSLIPPFDWSIIIEVKFLSSQFLRSKESWILLRKLVNMHDMTEHHPVAFSAKGGHGKLHLPMLRHRLYSLQETQFLSVAQFHSGLSYCNLFKSILYYYLIWFWKNLKCYSNRLNLTAKFKVF